MQHMQKHIAFDQRAHDVTIAQALRNVARETIELRKAQRARLRFNVALFVTTFVVVFAFVQVM
jgi:hypothetical protein